MKILSPQTLQGLPISYHTFLFELPFFDFVVHQPLLLIEDEYIKIVSSHGSLKLLKTTQLMSNSAYSNSNSNCGRGFNNDNHMVVDDQTLERVVVISLSKIRFPMTIHSNSIILLKTNQSMSNSTHSNSNSNCSVDSILTIVVVDYLTLKRMVVISLSKILFPTTIYYNFSTYFY